MIGDRWGVTDAEVARHYPCDDVVVAPVLQAWRGVDVAASPAVLWSWVVQIQHAPYSYDLIDNRGRRSPPVRRPGPGPRVGEHFTTAATGRVGRVLAVEPGVTFTGEILGAVMSYVVVPVPSSTGVPGPPTSARLLLKLVMAHGRLLAPAVAIGDLVMARRQLRTLRRLAESVPPAAR